MANTLTEFVFKIEDRPGSLATITEILGKAGINLDACVGFRSEGKGVVHLIPNDPDAAATSLKAAKIKYDRHEVFEVALKDRPGEVARLARALGDEHVNIIAVYITMKQTQIFVVDNQVNAVKVFQKLGL